MPASWRCCCDASSPRMVATTAAVAERLSAGGGPLYRYLHEESPDGIPGDGGAFVLCSFWLVENLAKQASSTRQLACTRTCRFPASSFRTKHHAFAHGRLRVSVSILINPSCSWRYLSEKRDDPCCPRGIDLSWDTLLPQLLATRS